MESYPYRYQKYIRKGNECTEIFMPSLYEFNKDVSKYINALLNSCGGIIKLGIGKDGYVHGIQCLRDVEDNIKLTIDNTVKFFQPKVSPSLYRLNFVQCDILERSTGCLIDVLDVKVVEIHVSAGSEILYMDKTTQKSMVLHNSKPMVLSPQQIQALAIAKYKQEVLSADTLWDVITPACMKKKESKLKNRHSTSAVICTQTTPGLAPAATPRPRSYSANGGISTSNTPCPTPVAELFISPQNTPNTVLKASNKRSLSPDNTGSAVKRMPPRSCKAISSKVVVIENSPDVVCIGTFNKANDNAISIPSDLSPSIPFAVESNGDTVVRRVTRSSTNINIEVVSSLVKNPSELFNEEPEEGDRSRTRKRHEAGDSSRHKTSKKHKTQRSSSEDFEKRKRHKSHKSKSPERRKEQSSSRKGLRKR